MAEPPDTFDTISDASITALLSRAIGLASRLVRVASDRRIGVVAVGVDLQRPREEPSGYVIIVTSKTTP